jgi:RimJ/RimL family protein N-acetyltransferase
MSRPPFETERLLVRLFTPDDLDDVYREVYSDPEVCHFFCGKTRTREETADWLAFRITEWKYSEFGRLAVVLKDTHEFLGHVGLETYVNSWFRMPDVPPPCNGLEVELSFAFGKRYWGKGYAYEACQPMLRYAFDTLKLPRLVGGAARENEYSWKLQDRLGYTRIERTDWPGYVTVLQNPLITEDGRAVRDHRLAAASAD